MKRDVAIRLGFNVYDIICICISVSFERVRYKGASISATKSHLTRVDITAAILQRIRTTIVATFERKHRAEHLRRIATIGLSTVSERWESIAGHSAENGHGKIREKCEQRYLNFLINILNLKV